ncbi:MAG: MaoC family dehydratase [Burkholderiales bacterium]
MVKTFDSAQALAECIGQEVAVSDWVPINQPQINQFAQATGDHQWIHVDEAKAKAGPFGAPIAHGFLTLSLLPIFFEQCIALTPFGMGVNYGLNKVRFMAPVPVGSRLRGRLKLLACDAVDASNPAACVQLTWDVVIEREGVAKPVCVAQSLVRYYR